MLPNYFTLSHSSPIIDSVLVLFAFCIFRNWVRELKLCIYANSDDKLGRARVWNQTCSHSEPPLLSIRIQVTWAHQPVYRNLMDRNIVSLIQPLRLLEQGQWRVFYLARLYLFILLNPCDMVIMDEISLVSYYPLGESSHSHLYNQKLCN